MAKKVKILTYYAKNTNNDLFQYKWGADETFYISVKGEWEVADIKDYEILEIGYFHG